MSKTKQAVSRFKGLNFWQAMLATRRPESGLKQALARRKSLFSSPNW